MFDFPFSIWDVILPIDFHIFQRGRYTTNQHVFCLPFQDIAVSPHDVPMWTAIKNSPTEAERELGIPLPGWSTAGFFFFGLPHDLPMISRYIPKLGKLGDTTW